jgi:dTDP-4-dehydrorhamnose 3,5-epimerase
MKIESTAIPEVKVITPNKYGDHRGFFSEVYNAKLMAESGITHKFVQDNHSFSQAPFTLRGLHYQKPPFCQTKLVRVLKGSAIDVAVDIRVGSPTFRQYVTVELRADLWNQILVPEGFAHAVLTLEPDTDIFYKVTDHYSPENDRGILWNDPELKIQLPVSPDKVILSEKDRWQPLLKDADNPFVYAAK